MDASLRTLREDIDKSKWILDEGMYNWAKRTKQDFYTTHPTEKAHAIWVDNHLLHSQSFLINDASFLWITFI